MEQVRRRCSVHEGCKTKWIVCETKSHNGRDDGKQKPERDQNEKEPLLLCVGHILTYPYVNAVLGIGDGDKKLPEFVGIVPNGGFSTFVEMSPQKRGIKWASQK